MMNWNSVRPNHRSIFARFFKPLPDQNVWEYARDNVDYSLCPAYDAESKSRYDPEYIPLFKEISECVTNPNVRKMVIRKCSRAGGTETILNGLRFHVERDPIPILWVGDQQETTESFFYERVIEGLKVTKGCAEKLKRGRVKAGICYLEDCIISSSYYGSSSGARMKGYALVVLDEFSKAKKFEGESYMKRIDNYRTGMVIFISSMNEKAELSSEFDPLNLEFQSGDQRYWHIQHEKDWFIPDMGIGASEKDYGIRFDESARREDGIIILQKVYDTAHYLTPDGAKLSQSEFKKLVKQGKWIPTNEELAAPKTRSYQIESALLPFECGDLGHLAVGWIEAKRKGEQAERIWIYENQPCIYKQKIRGQIETDQVFKIQAAYNYERGVIPTTEKVIPVLICDVQSRYIEWAVWALGQQDQWLIDHGTGSVLEDLDGIAEIDYNDLDGNTYNCLLKIIDTGFRTTECYEYCLRTRGAIPIKGDTGHITKSFKPINVQDILQYPDGRALPRRSKLLLRHLHPTLFRDQLCEALEGYEDMDPDIRATKINIWFHNGIDEAFAEQITAEVKDIRPDKYGYETVSYKKIRKKNEQFDLGHYAFAARFMLKVDLRKLARGQETDKAKPAKTTPAEPEKKKVAVNSDDRWDEEW